MTSSTSFFSATPLFTREEGHAHGVTAGPEGECTVEQGEYDTTLHVAAIFILVAVSFIGTMVPKLTATLSQRMKSRSIRSFKLVGSGIIISTAIIHMFLPGVLIFDVP